MKQTTTARSATDKKPKVYTMPFAKVYDCYIAKVQRKNRTKEEVDEIITWLTGYTQKSLATQLNKQIDVETFFNKAPKLNLLRHQITGTICGIRIEQIKEPTMKDIRYLDKLIDELAKGKNMQKILFLHSPSGLKNVEK